MPSDSGVQNIRVPFTIGIYLKCQRITRFTFLFSSSSVRKLSRSFFFSRFSRQPPEVTVRKRNRQAFVEKCNWPICVRALSIQAKSFKKNKRINHIFVSISMNSIAKRQITSLIRFIWLIFTKLIELEAPNTGDTSNSNNLRRKHTLGRKSGGCAKEFRCFARCCCFSRAEKIFHNDFELSNGFGHLFYFRKSVRNSRVTFQN